MARRKPVVTLRENGWTPYISKRGHIIGPHCFRDSFTGALNKKDLRIAAVYRLLKRKMIGQRRALELPSERHSAKEMQTLRATVEIWKSYPLKDMAA